MPELVTHCGICGDMFADINDYLTKEFETETEIRFPYGNHYGWSVKHKKLADDKKAAFLFPLSGSR